MDNLTIVTGFIDLNKIETRPIEKTKSDYLKWAEFLFKLRLNIVFFIEDDLMGYVTEKRREYGLENRTFVVKRNYDELNFYNKRDKIKQMMRKNFNPDLELEFMKEKITFNYLMTIWNKPYLMEEVVNKNPFGTEYFGWMDFGIDHISSYTEEFLPKDIQIEELLIPDSDKLKILQIENTYEYEIEDLKKFTTTFCRIGNGYWTAKKENMLEIINLYKNKLEWLLDNQIPMIEENIFCLIYMENKQLFDLYYGYYSSTLCNYKKIYCPDEYIFKNMHQSRINQDYYNAYNIGSDLFENLNILNSSQKLFLFYEGSIIVHVIDKEEYDDFILLWFSEIKGDNEHFKLVLENWDVIEELFKLSEHYEEIIKEFKQTPMYKEKITT